MSVCKVHNVKFYKLKPKGINCMSCNRAQKKLALSRSDATIEIWNLTHTPHIEKTIPNQPNSSIEALNWYRNRLFSVGLTNELLEYDLKSLKPRYAVPITGGAGWCMDVHSKTKKIVIGTESGYVNLFSITDDGVEYEKVFDKQDGRILCIKFEKSGKFVASGSADTVRIWNVETGHAIHKMNIARSHTKTETVVWDLVITDNFTIVTGDSRGYITFWDGNVGSQIESYQSHVASVLTLCLSENQKTLYCAGVDPLIVSYEKICVKEDSIKWVKSVQRKIHDHDVRNLVLVDDRLYSAGIDGYLSCSYFPPRTLVKYPPLLQGNVVFTAKENDLVLLRYHNYLEIWQLGKESSEEKNAEGLLQLEDEPKKLLLLHSKDEEFINCAAMSANGHWIFYSTWNKIRLFNLNYGTDAPELIKISSLPDECTNCINGIFSPDSSHLALVSQNGELLVFQLTGEQIFLVQKIPTHKYLQDTATFLRFSPCGKYIILADPMSNVAVLRRADSWIHHCSLPKYKSTPTALQVQPNTNNLLVVYADHKIVEYDLKLRKFTGFSRGLDERHPRQWLNRSLPVVNVSFDPRAENIVFLHDDSNICVIDKEKKLPKADTKIPKMDSSSNTDDSQCARNNEHAFHIIKKNKHLVYFGSVDRGEMISVEINPLSLYECLPPCLEKKTFGKK